MNKKPPTTEQLLKAADSFKDWSNYLLITTVAALGWAASENHSTPSCLHCWIIGLFAVSVIFAIFTLALIPLVMETLNTSEEPHDSIYHVDAPFRLVWLWGPEINLRLKHVCWPQHITFLAGIILYAVANIK